MVYYSLSDVISIADFALSWRITDPKWARLPDEVLHRIIPLSPEFSKELYSRSPLAGRGVQPFRWQDYHVTRDKSLRDDDPDNQKEVQVWLRQLPIPSETDVYVCWAEDKGVAIATDYQTFVGHWDDLWYPFDILCVFDEKADWALIMGPEEFAAFVERGPVDPRLPKSDPSYGLRLMNAAPQE